MIRLISWILRDVIDLRARAVLVDLSSYSLVVPVVPFRLQALGYGDVGGKTGWLVSAYAGGLIVSSPVVAVIGAKYKNRQIPLFLGLLFMAAAVVIFMEAKTFGEPPTGSDCALCSLTRPQMHSFDGRGSNSAGIFRDSALDDRPVCRIAKKDATLWNIH